MNHTAIDAMVDRVDDALLEYFRDKDHTCHPLDRAMEYSVLAGGKRMRPLLVLATCQELGGSLEDALPFSIALAFLHTYSLIHDDLPMMDNDDLRRGKPTNHKVFGEANAILAGDALHTEAFKVLAHAPHPNLTDAARIKIIEEFANACGRRGMVAGQVMDMEGSRRDLDLATLQLLHERKTGALILFSVRLGAYLAGANEAQMKAVTKFGRALGLLFQVVDDLLDIEGDAAQLGKTAGKDLDQNKATFPKLLGVVEARNFADGLLSDALEALTLCAPKEKLLETLAMFVRNREH